MSVVPHPNVYNPTLTYQLVNFTYCAYTNSIVVIMTART